MILVEESCFKSGDINTGISVNEVLFVAIKIQLTGPISAVESYICNLDGGINMFPSIDYKTYRYDKKVNMNKNNVTHVPMNKKKNIFFVF